MGLTDEEEVERPAVDPDRHAEADLPGRRLDPADLSERATHRDSGAGRLAGMVLTGEEEQQRVAAELDQAAAVPVRDSEEPGEDGAEDVGDLFGPDLPASARVARTWP